MIEAGLGIPLTMNIDWNQAALVAGALPFLAGAAYGIGLGIVALFWPGATRSRTLHRLYFQLQGVLVLGASLAWYREKAPSWAVAAFALLGLAWLVWPGKFAALLLAYLRIPGTGIGLRSVGIMGVILIIVALVFLILQTKMHIGIETDGR